MNSLSRVLLPGLVLQGLIIGGGYATGRELVEFFLRFGVNSTFWGLAVVGGVWGVVFSIAFGFARATSSYDYGSFTKSLLGPVRYVFDFVVIAFLVLIVAVVSLAAGEIAAGTFGLDAGIGTVLLAVTIVLGVALPSKTLGRVIAVWSVVLFLAYIALALVVFAQFGDEILQAPSLESETDGWLLSAIQYSAYNLAAIPAVLFVLKELASQKEAMVSGLIAGIVAIAPSLLLVVILSGFLPEVLEAPVPIALVLSEVSVGPLALLMQIAFLGTFWQTGVGSLNALNDRLAIEFTQFEFSPAIRLSISAVFVLLSLGVGGAFGIIALIASGYGAVTFGFLALLVLPLLTIGVYRLVTAEPQ